jgi:dTDP-glucose 4,6-dehydratase
MRILVTGGCGFIGSALVRRLVRGGDEVVNVDALTYAGSVEALEECAGSPRHVLVRADVRDAETMRRAFADHDPDAVIHLAAESHVDRSIDAPAKFVTTNVVGTSVMLEAALAHWSALPSARRAAFRFVHVSTDEVFGSLGPTGKFAESSPYRPGAPYAATKAAADHLVRAWHATYGLPAIVTCSTNNYGPWQFPEKLVPLVILKALAGEPIPVYGTGENVREWLHVEDHARGLHAALLRATPGDTLLFGSGQERRNVDVVRAICAILDELRPDPVGPRERLVVFVADRPAHDRRYALDDARTRREMRWTPEVSFDEGLRATVQWYLDHEEWWTAMRARGYRQERLGLSRGPSPG